MALNELQKKECSEYLERNLEITDCSQRKPYVFISYASDNWETVFKNAVVPLQQKYGLCIYADKVFDKVNDRWIVPMLRNIRGADAVVAFVSQNYIESYACFLELLTAINYKKQIVFVSLEDELHLGDMTDQLDIERGVKNEMLNQGANIAANTNNTSNDLMRAMKSAYTNISTLLEQDALSKYDISDAFITFFRDASINRKTINDLKAVKRTIGSVSIEVFDKSLISKSERIPTNEVNLSAPTNQPDGPARYEQCPQCLPEGNAPRSTNNAPKFTISAPQAKRTSILNSFFDILKSKKDPGNDMPNHGNTAAMSMPTSKISAEIPKVNLKEVYFSAVAPKVFIKGQYSIVNIVMYEEAFRKVVDELIDDSDTSVKEVKSGMMQIADYSRVRIVLTSPDISIDDNQEERKWMGDYLNFCFAVLLPEEYSKQQILFNAILYINDVIAARLKFTAKCFSDHEQRICVMRKDILSAFISYASQDRTRVAMIIQGMQKARPDMDIFFDIDSLRSGEDWEKVLKHEIEKRDILFLCWSHFAKDSIWVDKEWRYALENKGIDSIEPIPIETPRA